ncbi:LuxR family transcriptional regulator [Rhizobium sp. K1/93]|nr:LuxR family transcriptional regulator [Rhizobium sp. L58/93]QXZ82356.1 LuxR family transcriptional regulator [Rhizobium sp. K1/93]QXZ90131.1 LuxR family transcriptional regulator [Rhizobium sp. K15/93]QYA02668.1 LuxR family transcriptional regulator [Rhizobium sp. B21/90]
MLEFIDEIYEAAAVPENWTGNGVLEKLANVAKCVDGILFAIAPDGGVRWVSNDAANEKMETYVRDRWVLQNPYLQTEERIRKFNEPRFLLDTDVMSAEEMRESSYYQNFMLPHGCYWHAGTSIIAASGDTIKLSVHRSFEAGPLAPKSIDQLTALRPHLARASLIAARLRFQQVKIALDALDAMGFMAAAIKNGRLLQAGANFAKLIPSVIEDRSDKIVFKAQSANRYWANLIEGKVLRYGGSFPIAATELFSSMVVHILPIAGSAHDVFGTADALIAVTEASRELAVADGTLMGLYDLTPAESEVAREIAAGRDVNSIAKLRGVSTGTIRVQLHSIFEKTGARRQSELTRLISQIGRQ